MDKDESKEILEDYVQALLSEGYGALENRIGDLEVTYVEGKSGSEYCVELSISWDGNSKEAIRISGGIDDGNISALFPITYDEIINKA